MEMNRTQNEAPISSTSLDKIRAVSGTILSWKKRYHTCVRIYTKYMYMYKGGCQGQSHCHYKTNVLIKLK